MRRSIIVVLCLLVLLSGCTVIIDIDRLYGNLEGYVHVESPSKPGRLEPLSKATVTVRGIEPFETTRTDGSFFFHDLPQGWALVTITHDNKSILPHPLNYWVWITADKNNKYEFNYPEKISGKGHYIFIGIDEYLYHNDDLMPANSTVSVNDAQAVKRAFEQAGAITGSSEILLNHQATFSGIERAIENASYNASQDDYLVLYFSGFADGELRGGPNNLDHLVPYDGKSYGNKNEMNVITDHQLRNWLEKYFPNNKNITVIIDASYSASFVDGKATPLSIEMLALKDSGYTVLASARTTQAINVLPNIHSTFTMYMLEGINSLKADQYPYDGVITAYELYRYVGDAMDAAYYKPGSSFKRQLPVLEPVGSRTVIIRK